MKQLLCTAVLCFSLSGVFAQQGWSIGDKGFIGHSWTVGNKPSEATYKVHATYAIGRNAVYNFNENIGVGFGTYFSSEGYTFGMDKYEKNVEQNLRTNIIRVPVFANINFGDAQKRIRPHVIVGPSVGFLVGGRYTMLSKDLDAFLGAKAKKIISTDIDAGVNAGIGFTFKVANGILINNDVNYYHGFVDQKVVDPDVNSGNNFTNRNLTLSMGMMINHDAIKSKKRHMFGK